MRHNKHAHKTTGEILREIADHDEWWLTIGLLLVASAVLLLVMMWIVP